MEFNKKNYCDFFRNSAQHLVKNEIIMKISSDIVHLPMEISFFFVLLFFLFDIYFRCLWLSSLILSEMMKPKKKKTALK